jgi:hypothetical protein
MARHGTRVLVAAAAVLLGACGRAAPLDEPQSSGPQKPEAQGKRGPLVTVLGPDQIPAIDQPRFIAPQDAGWLAGREPVVSLEIGGDARAYPVQILTWHEIVNDVVAGRPVAVTYCPLCNSAVAYDRTVEGRALDFGTSGKLYQSALVMYDRQTGSLWTHFDGLAIQGELTGTKLELIPVQMLSFDQWRAQYPEGRVLSRSTGEDRAYGDNPYVGYDGASGPRGFFFRSPVDPRLPAMARVVGVEIDGRAAAYPYSALASGPGVGALTDEIGGRPVAVFWQSGVASALDTEKIAQGQDVGTSGVFVAETEGQQLTFQVRTGGIVDRETGSAWSIAGRAVSGPLEGTRLQPLVHIDAFWFAWQAYHPDTRVYG